MNGFAFLLARLNQACVLLGFPHGGDVDCPLCSQEITMKALVYEGPPKVAVKGNAWRKN
ncbi:hypothetical protein [Paraburkholderia xenovorans]|uniref:hypothetical protein n=1 Tax=Paraburkholderia xenovorans TaxID=36873 RepID=UPI0038BD3422